MRLTIKTKAGPTSVKGATITWSQPDETATVDGVVYQLAGVRAVTHLEEQINALSSKPRESRPPKQRAESGSIRTIEVLGNAPFRLPQAAKRSPMGYHGACTIKAVLEAHAKLCGVTMLHGQDTDNRVLSAIDIRTERPVCNILVTTGDFCYLVRNY